MNVAVYVVHGRELFELFHRADCTHGSTAPALQVRHFTSRRGEQRLATLRSISWPNRRAPSRSTGRAELDSGGDAGSKHGNGKESVKKTTSNVATETTVHGNYLRNICIVFDT
jgi:hypothetical protein